MWTGGWFVWLVCLARQQSTSKNAVTDHKDNNGKAGPTDLNIFVFSKWLLKKYFTNVFQNSFPWGWKKRCSYGLKAVKRLEETNSAWWSHFKMEMQWQCVLSGTGAGTGFSKDFISDLEKGLNCKTSKSTDNTNLSQVVKCHSSNEGWGDLLISHTGRSRRTPPHRTGR